MMTSNFLNAATMAPLAGAGQGGTGTRNNSPPMQNRAAESRSPYIRSQQESLVKWQLLDSESVDRARRENKLIFLHVGYKACHQCRLLSLESFSNQECASLLNTRFVPIIADREQRPDIDDIYMNYIQAVSNSGGWPLNLFLTADMEPVFGGTYWPGPRTTRRISSDHDEEVLDFLSILKKVRDVWSEQESRCRNEAREVVGQLREFAAEGTLGTRSISGIRTLNSSGSWIMAESTSNQTPATSSNQSAEQPSTRDGNNPISSELDLDLLEEAYTRFAGSFDPVYGGFGLAPKFVTAPKLTFLLDLNKSPAEVKDVVGPSECSYATDMAIHTLRKIRDGALRDHLGGAGFARFAITPDWSIPNFERLVVDNALLLGLYLDAWVIKGGTKNDEFYDVVMELTDYLTSSPILLSEGAFASSEAADSPHRRGDSDMVEGAYHLWTRREFDSVVDGEDHRSPVVAAHWDVQEDGNVEEQYDPNDVFINQNILRIVKTPEQLSRQFSLPVSKVEEYIQQARSDLRKRRDRDRIRPELDDKVVSGWNGLIISSLARTGSALQRENPDKSKAVLKIAANAAHFIKQNMWDTERKILYRVWRDGTETDGFAEDYAYLIRGLLDLHQATHDRDLLNFATELQEVQLSLFYDPAGAFYCTTANAPHIILRLKNGMDTALPSTNAVSVSNLNRLGELLAENKYKLLARETINAFEAEMLQHPWLYPGLLAGVVYARLGREMNAPNVAS
ncbi:hypothetical protein B0I35DRAFT_433788 [Stachybotrys elegans]|uniref:Spermatogenesis-associated protein 20-like TRX domain-containing protein n=1 Tax=Stachybotrys elegans TaxID=80388 RepID=A0A8K0SUP5_9HYPO|nr:hypothetical protein B0I35DRAFT_433788 [Stachybotrys elegans]